MNEPICMIVGAAALLARCPTPKAGDLVIAADGGYRHLQAAGIAPDIVVGDFDSAPAPMSGQVIKLPCEKDDTDMMAAIKLGLARGYRAFALYGGTGGRIDHTLGNIQALCYLAQHGAQGRLYDAEVVLTAITNARLRFTGADRGTVSVFPLAGDACGVSIEGLKYPLNGVKMRAAVPLGVSNELLGGPGAVTVTDGTLVIVYPRSITPPRIEGI
ncbi:MAG: thiamine diphosphokinase [Clostridia bacterium]